MMVTRKTWTGEEKIRILLESLNTSISQAELCRKYNVNPSVVIHWRQKFFEGGRAALMSSRGRVKDAGTELAAENERLKKLIGELTIANDSFKKILEGRGGGGGRRS